MKRILRTHSYSKQVLKKIMTAPQLRDVDNYTIKNNDITSWELMERAATAFVNALEIESLATKKIRVVCGIGNNGGDGLAIARLLRVKGLDVTIFLVKFNDKLSEDCSANLLKLNDVILVDSKTELPNFSNADIIIDGIFGTGLTRPVTGLAATVIDAINTSGKIVFSIDVPSGMNCDEISTSEHIVKADLVITFQRPKLAFFFPENGTIIKKWKVVEIGLDEAYIQAQKSGNFLLDDMVRELIMSRQRQSHKGMYGHALLVAGSYGKMGASVLSAKGCLRSGVGLLTTHVPKCGYEIMQISVPEAMCSTDENDKIITIAPDLTTYDSIGIGPGIGKEAETAKALGFILKNSNSPLVLDADALNLLSENRELLEFLPEHTILTPHIKEFDRLVGESLNTIDRLKKQQAFSQTYKTIIVLKDARTCISSPEGEQYFNTSGNPGMATGGSGDVLTGIITGLLAQGYQPLDAALLGVYFHGLAGDRAAQEKGFAALIASDLCDYLKIEANTN